MGSLNVLPNLQNLQLCELDVTYLSSYLLKKLIVTHIVRLL